METSSGWFAKATSPDVDVDTMHRIHLNPDWPATTVPYGYKGNMCPSCHARPACDTCHTGSVGHGVHPYGVEPGTGHLQPWTGVVCTGTPAPEEHWSSHRSEQVTCDVEGCHTAAAYPAPTWKDPNAGVDPVTYASLGPVTLTGTWNRVTTGAYLYSWVHYASAAGASFATTVTASRVDLVDPRSAAWGGYADVYFDGVKVDTINAYAPSSQTGQTIWSSGWVPQGTHTLRFVVTGGQVPGSIRNWFPVDAIEVFSRPVPFRPTCLSCHAEMERQHTP